MQFRADSIEGLDIRELSAEEAGNLGNLESDHAVWILKWGCHEFADTDIAEIKRRTPFRVIVAASKRILELSGMSAKPDDEDPAGNA